MLSIALISSFVACTPAELAAESSTEVAEKLTTSNATSTTYGSVDVSVQKKGDYWYLESIDMLVLDTDGSRVRKATNSWTTTGMRSAVDAMFTTTEAWNYFASAHGWDGLDAVGGPTNKVLKYNGAAVLTVQLGSWTGWDAVNDVFLVDSVTVSETAAAFAEGILAVGMGIEPTSVEGGALSIAAAQAFGLFAEASTSGASVAWPAEWTAPAEHEGGQICGTSISTIPLSLCDASGMYTYALPDTVEALEDTPYITAAHAASVPGLVLFMLSEGGAHPRLGGTSVTGLGETRTAEILFDALETLSSNPSLEDLRDAMLAAASSSEDSSVDAAWNHVGL